jgi:hypothetical protein
MSILTVIIFCLVLLLFDTTRLFGIIVLTLITYSYPMMLILIIAISGTYFYFTQPK